MNARQTRSPEKAHALLAWRRGQSTAEFALVITPMLLLFFAIINFALSRSMPMNSSRKARSKSSSLRGRARHDCHSDGIHQRHSKLCEGLVSEFLTRTR